MTRDPERSTRPAFRIASHVLHRTVDGQIVLLDLANEQYFGLNHVGAAMLIHLTEHPLEDAVTALISQFDVDPDVLRRDLGNLIESLEKAGLIERVTAPE